MSSGFPFFATFNIDAGQVAPKFLHDHSPGRVTLDLVSGRGSIVASLAGTLSELHAFAQAIHLACIAHETGTELAGTAAAEVVEDLPGAVDAIVQQRNATTWDVGSDDDDDPRMFTGSYADCLRNAEQITAQTGGRIQVFSMGDAVTQ